MTCAVRNILVDGSNIASQSYFNLVKLSQLSGFADPIRALRGTNARWTVAVDASGNVVSIVSNVGSPNRSQEA